MKIKKSILRKIIREEAGRLVEGCPVDLPCPYAMADELKASGASPEELLSWVATLTQELVSPSGGEAAADAEGVLSTFDDVSEPASLPMGIALENRRRGSQKLSSRQLRNIIESVVGPGELIRRPSKPVLPKKRRNRPGTKRSSTLRKRR